MIKGFYESRKVFIDDWDLRPHRSQKIINHSPDGFSWGYGGSGPAQLALAMLLYFTDDEEFSRKNYQDFKWDVIARLPQTDFTMKTEEVEGWIEEKELTQT